MSNQHTARVSPEAYLEFERKAASKHEYLKGEVFAMAGASLRHNLIAANIVAALKQQLKQTDCKVAGSDMRVAAPGATLYTYPDVVAFCGEPRPEDEHFDTLLNPRLIVEVLSKSTAAYDREIKFGYYRTIEPLAEYLLIAQDEWHVAQHTRQPGGRWLITDYRSPQDALQLQSVRCRLSLKGIYEGVSIP